jgi:YidC/Oxa1 family membrane protein insertase
MKFKKRRQERIEEKIDWVAFKNQFFSAVMIAKNNFKENSLMTSNAPAEGLRISEEYQAKMKTFFDPTGRHLRSLISTMVRTTSDCCRT